MKLQVRAFASLMGVSVRTLHYYDEIGLLCPAEANEQNGYRYYDDESMERMRQILYYREMGFSLNDIGRLLYASAEVQKEAFGRQKAMLLRKIERAQRQLECLEGARRRGMGSEMSRYGSTGNGSMTALLSAFARAFHNDTARHPVFSDTKARELMTAEEYKMIAGYILGGIDFLMPERKGSFANIDEALRCLVNTQFVPTPVARGRFCEDSLKTAVLTGTQQYVILGAGLDSFAFREKELVEKCCVFEVDRLDVQADKLKRIHRAGWVIPDGVKFVSMDFKKDDLKEKLLHAGFDIRKKTFFSWLGVSYYLTIEEIENMIGDLAAIAAEGSTLLFDFADAELFSSNVKRVQNMIAMAAAANENMKTCFSDEQLTYMLERQGFLIYELMDQGQIQKTYFSDRDDGLKAFEHIKYALAVLKKCVFLPDTV